MSKVLTIQRLSKHFGRIKAVDDLSLEINEGEVFGILGPNGSGKTTTLGVVLDVIKKTSGEYFWFERPPDNTHRKRIGAILETPVFYPYLSAVRNLEIVAKIKEVSTSRIVPVLEKVELAERKDDKFRTYSLGMKQRLAIASALLCDPEVMILDEPTNGLDPQGIAEIRELIRRIAQEGKTIILASHLLDEVQKVCSHFAVLKKGTLLHQGPVAEVTKGVESVEVAANGKVLEGTLKEFAKVIKVEKNLERYTVTLEEGATSVDLNRYLIEKGVVVSHLLSQRKTLEKQFLELLAESENNV